MHPSIRVVAIGLDNRVCKENATPGAISENGPIFQVYPICFELITPHHRLSESASVNQTSNQKHQQHDSFHGFLRFPKIVSLPMQTVSFFLLCRRIALSNPLHP